MMKLFGVGILCFLLASCENGSEGLLVENQRLKIQNDSLKAEISNFKLMPYLEPVKFETSLNDTFYTKALLIQQNGLTIDSLAIKGLSQTETDEMVDLVSADNGTGIKFNATRVGTFRLKLFARVPIWDNKVVPMIIPINVKEEITGGNIE